MSLNSLDFRHTMSRFVTGVTVVIMKDEQNELHGVTINSLTSVSLEPPLILFCLKTASKRCALLQKVRAFSVNILSDHQESVADYFSRRDLNDIPRPEFMHTPALTPSLHDCVAYLYGNVELTYSGGDHTIFLSRVTHLSWDQHKNPLIFYTSQYAGLPPLNPYLSCKGRS